MQAQGDTALKFFEWWLYGSIQNYKKHCLKAISKYIMAIGNSDYLHSSEILYLKYQSQKERKVIMK